MRNNIIILANSIVGLYVFRKEVVQAICEKGYGVYISVPDDSPNAVFFKELGCQMIHTDFNRRGMNPLSDIRLLLSYIKLIKRLKPIAVLTYTIKPNVYGGMACRLTKTAQLANITGLGDALEKGGWLQKLTIFLYKIGVGNAKCVFFQNKNNQDFCINNGIEGAKSVLIPGSGVNLIQHQYQQYPLDDIIKFLFISRLIRDKGTEEFFNMAVFIKNKYPNTEFQILGWCESKYKKQLDELVDKGVINYLGSTSDVRPYIANVHCTIMPSYHEGMSNVNLESAANGRPVITTNVPGCKETVDDGITGYLVNPRDEENLIHAVERFISLPYNQKELMGKNARKKAEREFDRQMVVKAYLKEIKDL